MLPWASGAKQSWILRCCFQSPEASVQAWSYYARVCLALGRTNDYYTACDRLLNRTTDVPRRDVPLLFDTLCLLPHHSKQASFFEKNYTNETEFPRGRGAFRFRKGLFSEAEKNLPFHLPESEFTGDDAAALFFAAMNSIQLDKAKEAAEAYNCASYGKDRHPTENV